MYNRKSVGSPIYVYGICQRLTRKFLHIFGMMLFLFVFHSTVQSATITSQAAGGTWGVAGTWVGGVIPGLADDVIIATSATVTVTDNRSCNSISWTGNPTASRVLTINSGFTLTVTGNITFAAATTNGRNRSVNVLGSLICGGDFSMGASGNDGRDVIITIATTGAVTITGNLIMPSSFARHHVDMTGSAVLNIGGNVGTTAAGTAAGGGFTTPTTINFNGTLPQNFFPATVNAIATLQVNNAAGLIMRVAQTVTTLTIGNVTSNSLFKDSGNTVTCTGTLNINNNSTYRLGRYSGTGGTATAFPAFATRNIDLGTTIEYAHSNAAQTVSTTPSYANLTLSAGAAQNKTIAAGTLAVRQNLTIGTNATFLGSTNNPATNLGGNFTNSGTFTSGTGLFTMNGTSNQSITGTAVFAGGLTIDNTGGGGSNTVTLSNAITTTGNLTVTAGIFDLGAFTANRTAGGGTMSIANGARLRIGGTNSLPTNYTTHTIGATSTVEYDGTANVVTAPNGGVAYGNLEINATGAVTSASFPVAGILSVLGSRSLVASAGTITMNNAASSIVNSGTLSFRGLTIAATPTLQSQYNASYNVATVFTVDPSVTFEPTGGTITMNNAASSIVNNGTLSFSGLTISVTPTAQSQYNASYSVAGALTISGAINFSPSGGTITMSGAAGSISNATGTLAFNNLNITGTTISSTGNFSVVGTMDVTSTFAPAATSVISGAGTLTGAGTVRVTRVIATPSFGAQYTIATKTLTNLTVNYIGAGAQTVNAENYGTLVISTNGTRTVTFINGGTIRVSNVFTPTATTTSYVVTGNTFEYNGSGAQTVTAFTYNILIISNAGDKTILAGTTVNCFNITLNDAAVLVMPDTSVLNVQE